MLGGHGGGGEYEVQLGFGWTNGIIIELLEMFGDRLSAEERFASIPVSLEKVESRGVQLSSAAQIVTVLFAVIATLIAGYIGWGMYEIIVVDLRVKEAAKMWNELLVLGPI